ncbi:transcription factor bHLH147-like protein isoform X1 [Cinnamomum micranthum f. kanehirae]|uniref:Transcription factor bHLH147-like protein isoform X1 n=1 Tax=Cinnamomum micranthum f. kanehirae TaxID=337451 RepID=A0A3S3P9Y4_9MAGN|nr:transcription factor bHLH147-like protein isoform X1 [Cinnamomum micranthum f. kanehirae]
MKNPRSRWRTATQERIYGQKLLQALRSTKQAQSQPLKLMARSRAIKDTADLALALTAKGQNRWSRAILLRQWQKRKSCLKAAGKMRRRTRVGKPGPGLWRMSPRLRPRRRKGEKVREKLRVLSRLVPGSRRLSALTLLEEAADYAAALEMQVKAMRTLAVLLSSNDSKSEC